MPDNRNLTVTDVQQRVDALREFVDDPEVLHSREDDLHAEVLLSIANMGRISGGQWAAEMASAARQSYRIGGERWYA